MSTAISLWGVGAWIAKVNPERWEYQIGCKLDGKLVLVGRGTSWEDAFQQVIPLNGLWRGAILCVTVLDHEPTSVIDPK